LRFPFYIDGGLAFEAGDVPNFGTLKGVVAEAS
jgi:hypothetical protein